MGFFGFSPSLKEIKDNVTYSKGHFFKLPANHLILIEYNMPPCNTTKDVSMPYFRSTLFTLTSGSKQLRLPVFFGLHLESILQPVQQLVGELAYILLLNKAHEHM